VITQSAKILAQISNFAKIEKCAQKIWRKKANLVCSKNVKMVNVKEAVSHFCSGSNNKKDFGENVLFLPLLSCA